LENRGVGTTRFVGGCTYTPPQARVFDEQSLRLESGLTPSTQFDREGTKIRVFGPYGVHYFENVRRKPYPRDNDRFYPLDSIGS